MSNPYDAVPTSGADASSPSANPYLGTTDGNATPAYPGPPAFDPYAQPAAAYAQPPVDPYAQPTPPPADPYAAYGAPAYPQAAPYPNPYYASPYGYVPPNNSTAIVSLVAGIAGITLFPLIASVVAIITGHIALSQIKERGEGGRGMALTGLIMGYVAVGGYLLIILMALGFGFWAYSTY